MQVCIFFIIINCIEIYLYCYYLIPFQKYFYIFLSLMRHTQILLWNFPLTSAENILISRCIQSLFREIVHEWISIYHLEEKFWKKRTEQSCLDVSHFRIVSSRMVSHSSALFEQRTIESFQVFVIEKNFYSCILPDLSYFDRNQKFYLICIFLFAIDDRRIKSVFRLK